MFIGNVSRYDPIAATDLRVTKRTSERSGYWEWIGYNSVVGSVEIRIEVLKNAGRRIVAVVILCRPKKVRIVARLRRQSELWRNHKIGIQFNRIVFCLIGWFKRRLDNTQILRLFVVCIW